MAVYAYLCGKLDIRGAIPTVVAVDVFSDSAATLTCDYKTHMWFDITDATGDNYDQAANNLRALVRKDVNLYWTHFFLTDYIRVMV